MCCPHWPRLSSGLSFRSSGRLPGLLQFTTVRDATFIGISNFISALRDTTFTHAFWYNCAFVVSSTLAINVGGLAVALILTKAIQGTNAFRTVFFMPNLIGGIVLGYIWQILLTAP